MVPGKPLARDDRDWLGPLLEPFLAVETARARRAPFRKPDPFLKCKDTHCRSTRRGDLAKLDGPHNQETQTASRSIAID
jgi:hypothetical protein